MIDKLKQRFGDTGSAPSRGDPAGRSPAANAALLKRFNPYDFDDAQVRAQATGRGRLVADILRVIRDNANRPEPPNQHLLVLGPRGMGKSFLVRWVQAAVNARERTQVTAEAQDNASCDTATDAPVRFVRLSEEQLNVSAPELLLDEIRRILERQPADAVRVRWRAGGEAEWRASLELLKKTIAALPGFAGGRGLVVVSIENFDLLLEEVFSNPAVQSRLRALLAAEPRLMLLATATRPPDEDADKRLFLAFERKQLAPWRPAEFVEFYRRAFRGGLDVTAAVEAKIRALAHFLGGSPRLAVLMGDILHSNDALSAIQTLDQLVDELTPYYQDRILTRLKPKPRWLLDEMLRGGDPCSQTELAKRVGATQSDISQYFAALQREQIVTSARETGGRKNLYRVTDRVFAHFYRKRYLAQHSHSPLAGMVDFLESFYTQQELIEQLERLTAQDELDKARILSQALWQGADWHGVANPNRRRVCRRLVKDLIEALGGDADAPLARALGALDALLQGRDTAGALNAAELALGLARTPAESTAVRIARGLIYTTLPADDKAVIEIRAAAENAANAEHGSLHALALEGLANAEAYAGDATASDAHFREAADQARAIGDHKRNAWIAAEQLWHFNLTERWDAFDEAFDAAVDGAASCGQPQILAISYHSRSYREWRGDDLDAALAASKKALEFAHDSGDDATLAMAASNYSASLSQLERYDEALEAALLEQQAARSANDEDWLLNGAMRELSALLQSKRHAALIERAPEVLALAQHLGDLERQVRIHGQVSDAHHALEQAGPSLEAQWRAADLSVRSKDDQLFSSLHGVLIHRLAADRGRHADELADAYIRWIHRITPSTGAEDNGPSRYDYRPRWQFDAFASAVTLSGRWPEVAKTLAQWERDHPSALEALPATSSAIGDAVAELFGTDGTGPAFSAAAGFLRTVGDVLTASDPVPALMDFLRALAHASCTRFIAVIEDPGLLRDLAQEVREQLKDDDIARGLEAAALYRERGAAPAALERVDPDIREAVMTLLGAHGGAPDPEDPEDVIEGMRSRFRGAGLRRADARINAEDREAIAASLRKSPPPWPCPPRCKADWTDLSPTEALEPVVAILGAARDAACHRSGELFLDLMTDEQGFGGAAARALAGTRAMRRTEPGFYPGWSLVECLVPLPAGHSGDSAWASLGCLLGKDAVVPLLGTSAAIHELNAELDPRLADAVQAADYLRFFCGVNRGDDGPFPIIEDLEQLPLTRALDPDEQARLGDLARPIRMESEKGKDPGKALWSTRALVQYAGGLFIAGFTIKPSGRVVMTDDEAVLAMDSIRRERLVSAMRWYDGVYSSSVNAESTESEQHTESRGKVDP